MGGAPAKGYNSAMKPEKHSSALHNSSGTAGGDDDNNQRLSATPSSRPTPRLTNLSGGGTTAAAITAILVILGEVLLGFGVSQPSSPPPTATTTAKLFTSVPILGLGVALLAVILAHAVGLFLQQEKPSGGKEADEKENRKSPPLYPGYLLAMIAFAVSALAGVACLLVSGVLLLLLLAYYRDLWDRPRLGPVILAISRAVTVLAGAAAGGWRGQTALLPALLLAGGATAIYGWAVEATSHGAAAGWKRWRTTATAGISGAASATWAFCCHGVSALAPWLAVWLALWLTARTISLTLAADRASGPWVQQARARQEQRGELLVLAGLAAALLPEEWSAAAFAVVFLFFPLAAWLDRR